MLKYLLGAILFLGFTYCRAQTDLTLVPGSSGEDVVDACIQKLSAISLFSNDYGFLKRIALVESKFGSNSTVINANPTGGIWQITTKISQAISNSTILQAILKQTEIVLGSDIIDFVDGDFRIPLKSALAARLYIEYVQLTEFAQIIDIPGTVVEQANWWSQYYTSNGQSNYFKTTVTNYENANRCTVSKMDLYFLLDGSGSIGPSDFQQSLDFVNQLASEFNISSEQVRTGLTIYSSSNYPISQFDQHQNNSAFSDAVTNTNYPGGGTNTGEGIEFVRTTMFNTSTGMRPLADGAPRILLVLTDGQSGDNVTGPSAAIKADGVTVFGVGVGSGFVENEIREIASDPDSDYAFGLSQFDQLVNILKDRVSVQACKIPALIPDDTEVPITIDSGDAHYSEVQMPTNGSIELSYTVTTIATATVYVSSSTTNPSSAVFDFFFELQFGVTVVTINSGETATSAVELVSNTYASSSSSISSRKKRAADNTMTSYPVYVTVKAAAGDQSLEATVKATGSNTRSKGGTASGIHKLSWMTALILALLVWILSVDI
ncbi:unnamed protein product [Clavelina lepadiformis]|uniref:VWFA domain-containing protein n=1 Tax=Clavelina lepadiformis TaxID=159417 RepID=A0ABP0FHE4_CLALP